MHMVMCIASRIEKNLIWKTIPIRYRLGNLLKNQSIVKGDRNAIDNYNLHCVVAGHCDFDRNDIIHNNNNLTKGRGK